MDLIRPGVIQVKGKPQTFKQRVRIQAGSGIRKFNTSPDKGQIQTVKRFLRPPTLVRPPSGKGITQKDEGQHQSQTPALCGAEESIHETTKSLSELVRVQPKMWLRTLLKKLLPFSEGVHSGLLSSFSNRPFVSGLMFCGVYTCTRTI
jgi:hypothetical protein